MPLANGQIAVDTTTTSTTSLPDASGQLVDFVSNQSATLTFTALGSGGYNLTGVSGGPVVAFSPDPVGVSDLPNAAVLGSRTSYTVMRTLPPNDGPADNLSATRHNIIIWAWEHYEEPWKYPANCTNFASEVLHNGGGLPYDLGFRWSDSNWWYRRYFGKNWATYSWSGASHLPKYLNTLGGSWLGHLSDAEPGDVLFYKYPTFDRINHTAIVTSYGTARNSENLGLTQSDHNYKTRRLMSAYASLYDEFGAYPTVYVRRIDAFN